MKRFLTLALCLNFVVCGLFAQKKSKNSVHSFLTVETGLSYAVQPRPNFLLPFNIEYQRVKNKFGVGMALGLDFDKYSVENEKNRLNVVGLASFYIFDPNTNPPVALAPYTTTTKYLNVKPSIFTNFYFLQNKKVDAYIKMGFSANILNIEQYSGQYFQFEMIKDTLGRTSYKVTNPGPFFRKTNYHSWHWDNISLLSSLGLNYALNKRMKLRFALQSETKLLLLSKYNEKSILFSGLCGLSFKI